MSYNKIILTCYYLGLMKKVSVKDTEYETYTTYKFRLWNPFTWVLYTLVVIAKIPMVYLELIKENNGKYEIIKRKNK